MRIPSFEDLGNAEAVIEGDEFFSTIAKGYVEGHVGGYLYSENTLYPTTVENLVLIDPDPFQTLRNAVTEISIQPSLDAIQYRVHVALHRLWVGTFGKEKGEEIRRILLRNYINIDIFNKTGE